MTLLLARSDVADLLPMDACIEAVEHTFRLHGEGRVDPPRIDSTEMALQDVAAAVAVYERAVRAGRGLEVNLAA